MSLNPAPEAIPGIRRRFIVLSLIAASIFGILALRLWHLQILGVDHYRELSDRNRIRYVSIDPPRGTLFDRNGVMLVDNRPAFTVSLLRQEIEDRKDLFVKLGEILGLETDYLEERWQAGRGLPRYRPLPLLIDVGREAMEKIQENSVDLPGVLIEVKPLRNYPRGEFAAHMFGYLGEVTEDELGAAAFDSYRAGDMVGKTALERLLESDLRGSEGVKRLEVNVKGRELRQVTTREPLPGNRVYLTIDADLQAAAEEAFGDEAGGAVALDIHSGKVLALVSRPSYDPALFARGISSEEWRSLVDNSRHPLQNKVLRGQYPPGSTFKVAVALAALEEGVATPETAVDCTGKFNIGSYEFRCWKRKGHGRTDLHKALRESCDIWFYRVGLELGIDKLNEAANKLGMGHALGFPFGKERSGLIPSRAWKRKRFGTSWYNGETVIASIGQGFVLTTPLQLATMTAAIANGGTVWKPTVVQRIENLEGEQVWISTPEKASETEWTEKHLDTVRKAMDAVVHEPGGTAWRSQLKEVRFAGKTGTAQVVRSKQDDEEEEEELEDIPYRFRDHALFVAFAPTENPEIAVAIVVEHGGHGSSAAAPIAKKMFQTYFGLNKEEVAVSETAAGGD
jgi:penicillin-binding protein 2